MRELSARWVPHLLTIDQKRISSFDGEIAGTQVRIDSPSTLQIWLRLTLFSPPNLKNWLSGQRFPSDAEVINAVNDNFSGLHKNCYSE